MNISVLKKKIAPILQKKGEAGLQDFIKEALFLHLQEANKKIAIFEGTYNKTFQQFSDQWKNQKNPEKFSYRNENDFLDWEAQEMYKHDLMKVIHSL